MAQSPQKAGKAVFDERARTILWRFLNDWVLPRWHQVALGLLFTAGLAATTGGYPLIIKHAFDALLQDQGFALPWVVAAIIGITLLRSIMLYLHQVTTQRLVLRMTRDIQKAAFSHLIHADYARLMRETTGHLVSRLTNDITYIQQAVGVSMIASVRDSLSVIALLATMFYLNWSLSLIAFVIYPLAILPVRSIGRRLRTVARRTQAELGDMTSRLTQKLSGARLIKAFRLEDYAVEKLDTHFDQIYQLRMKAIRAKGRMGPAMETLAGLAISGVVAYAYWRIANGKSTVGDFMGFMTALLLAAQPIRSVSNVMTSALEGLAAAERIYDLMDEKPAIVDRPDARPLAISNGAITFDNVSFAYGNAGNLQAVRNFSLQVPGRKTVAIVGPNGAGKSTVLNLVARLFDVQSGRILIDGQEVRDVTIASLRDQIAIVSQELTLFDDTIRANIGLGRLNASDAEIEAAAKAAAAHDFIMQQPDGYETMVGDGGMRLSGGQRQRLVLARAIIKDAPILLLDEATSALDAESERLVSDALARFTADRTTLVIAHRLATVQGADLICVMDGGRIAELGTHAELITRRNGLYARLCQSQAMADFSGSAAHAPEPSVT